MRPISRDSFPHLVDCFFRAIVSRCHTSCSRFSAWWWGVSLGANSRFRGLPRFRRCPDSTILIDGGGQFNSSPISNYIGVNRPCILATLQKGARIKIGSNCGFSGTVIGCAADIVIEDNVMCGSNTLITDTDWHTNDPRTGPDQPVRIKKGAWLGVNVTVLKGVTVGENTLVAAGSVVVASLPDNVVAGGVPAKVIKTISPLGES